MDSIYLLEMLSPDRAASFVQGLVYIFIAFGFLKPFLTRMVKDVQMEMAAQMSDLRIEIKSLRCAISELTGLVVVLQERIKSQDGRISKLEGVPNETRNEV